MSFIKRITATVISRVDQLVTEIENQDAIAQAAIDAMQKTNVEAKLRHQHVVDEAENIRQQISTLQQEIKRWHERAIISAESDEDKALQCITRARACQSKQDKLNITLTQYRQASDKLSRNIELCDQRQSEMKQKLTLMRARQSSCEALNTSQTIDHDTENYLRHSFERWETEISRAEINMSLEKKSDDLDDEFSLQETQADLCKELQTLVARSQK